MGKSSKKDAKKSSPPAVSPETVPTVVDVGKSGAGSTVSSSGLLSRPRSKSHSTKNVLSQATQLESNEPTPARRRATTRASEAAVEQISPDVFSFLDENAPDDANRLQQSRKTSSQAVPQARLGSKSDRRKSSASYSFNSDSGISVRDHSPDRASSIASRESAEYQPPTPPDYSIDPFHWKMGNVTGARHRMPMAGAYMTDTESLLEGPTSDPGYFNLTSFPESFYLPPKQLPKFPTTSAVPTTKASRQAHRVERGTKKSESHRRTSSNKEPLSPEATPIDKAAETVELAPLYRKFGSLNHRVLRHLQEEIANMEEDLIVLDELEETHLAATSSRSAGKQVSSATKRQELQPHEYSALLEKRSELFETIIQKTHQYNRSLCSFRDVMQTPAAKDEDVEEYRISLRRRRSTEKSEYRILSHLSDLVVLTSNPRRETPAPNPVYSTIVTISSAVLFPMLSFGIVNGFFGRIAVVAMVGLATALFASNGPSGCEYLIHPHDAWKCAAVYFGFMAVAAMIIS